MKVANTFLSRLVWRPASDRDRSGNTGDKFYQGQLTRSGGAGESADNRWPDGLSPAGAAQGAADTTSDTTLFGIIEGFNPRSRTLDSTYGVESLTAVVSSADQVARSIGPYGGHEPYADPAPKIQVRTITPFTPIRIPIYLSTINTAITVLTATAVSGTNVSATTNDCGFTPVANLCTIHCRTGNNEGIQRQTDDTSGTVAAFDKAFPRALAVDDTFVRVPYRIGPSYIQLDAESIFMDGSATPGTDYYVFHVEEMNLQIAGQEWIEGCFDPVHFMAVRA